MPVGDVWSETDTQSSKCAARAHIMLCDGCARLSYSSLVRVSGPAGDETMTCVMPRRKRNRTQYVELLAARAPHAAPPSAGAARRGVPRDYSYTKRRKLHASRYSRARAPRLVGSAASTHHGPRASLPTRLTQRGRGMGEHLFWIHTHYIYLSLSASWRRKKAAVCVERREKRGPAPRLRARAYGRRDKGL